MHDRTKNKRKFKKLRQSVKACILYNAVSDFVQILHAGIGKVQSKCCSVL